MDQATTVSKAAPPPPKRKRAARLMTVVDKQRVTPQMMRVVLTAPSLEGYNEHSYAAHIKLMLPHPGESEPTLPILTDKGPVWPEGKKKPIVRTYTVRHLRNGELAVDFVLHADHGPACYWALNCAPGDQVGVVGPAGPLPMIKEADYMVLAGDTSALPGIAAILEHLAEDAQGHAFIEIPDESEKQALRHPQGVGITWLVRGAAAPSQSHLLYNALSALEIPAEASLQAWVAGENSVVIELRKLLRERYGLAKPMLYAVPYWKESLNEEAYHSERHRVMDEL
ncbi:siderophore-interacting protein [Carnimonas nigrificans]|uniref:siderophore-interacting protein n=1 Tax=Carnimonas nigrificans TaxID=64323 RepID=UPI0004707F5A|nr:siderophore-interacting protein [Carnimonas nigrificans]